jgi:hypothetical protein
MPGMSMLLTSFVSLLPVTWDTPPIREWVWLGTVMPTNHRIGQRQQPSTHSAICIEARWGEMSRPDANVLTARNPFNQTERTT